jgi:hypothetical protein
MVVPYDKRELRRIRKRPNQPRAQVADAALDEPI